jgi:4-amino-4-deoxy-L-arabinose transferase-like glycosyltransferase
VETNQPGHQPSTDQTLLTRIGWTVLIIATLYVCYFSHLGAIGFVGPDEPRYAWIARDMAETGDWVTPRLYGKPWFEKPPLLYWGAALSFKLFGVSETTARLPSAVSALLATLALAWLALRLYGAETARWLLLFLPTTVGMIGFSHAAATDMPFSAMLTIAMVAAAVVVRLGQETNGNGAGDAAAGGASPSPTKVWLALVFFGFFLGLAVLAKGPAGIILSGGSVFFWAVFTKRWRDTFRLLHPAVIATFCLTALPWYILCARGNPDFFRVFIIEHNFKRYLTPEFRHIQPFWYYVPILLIAVLPWTAVLLWSDVVGVGRTRSISKTAAYFVSWAFFCFAFFSVSQSKLPGYILPAIPAIMFLLARSSVAFVPPHLKSFRLTMLVTAALLFAACILVLPFTRRMSQINTKAGVAAALILALFGATNLALGGFYPTRGQNGFRRLTVGFAVLPILWLVLQTDKLLPSFFPFDPSGRTLASELQLRKIPSEELAVNSMNRGLHYSLNFYLRSDIKDWEELRIYCTAYDDLRRDSFRPRLLDGKVSLLRDIQGPTEPFAPSGAASIKRNSPRDSHTRACLHHSGWQNFRARYSPAPAAPWTS